MLGVYVDLPWSYAAGAGIALAAAHQLRGARTPRGAHAARGGTGHRPSKGPPGREPPGGDLPGGDLPGGDPETPTGRAPRVKGAVTGRHLALAMAYGALVFVPASLYVAHRHPEWATMQRESAVGGQTLVRLAAAELALVATGFLLTRWLLVSGRIRGAVLQVITPCLAMAFLLIHGWDGGAWRRLISTGRADHRDFPDLVTIGDLPSLAAQVLEFAGSGVAATLLLTGGPVVGALALIMGVLHQFGLADGGTEGPGLLRAGFVGAVTIGGVLALAGVASLAVHGVGWLGLVAVVPAAWVAIVPTGTYATLVINDLALPAERE